MYKHYQKTLLTLTLLLTAFPGIQLFPHTVYSVNGDHKSSVQFNKLGNHVIVEFTQCKT